MAFGSWDDDGGAARGAVRTFAMSPATRALVFSLLAATVLACRDRPAERRTAAQGTQEAEPAVQAAPPSSAFVGTGPATENIMALAKSGKVAEADELARKQIEETKARGGRDSLEHAQALLDRATVLSALDAPQMAIEHYESCIATRGDSEALEQLRLTANMNLGERYIKLGRSDAAIQTLTEGLARRERLYGAKHAGTAYGAQTLGLAFLAHGDATKALAHARTAYEIFAGERHFVLPQAVALLASAKILTKDTAHAWDEANALPPPAFQEMLRYAALDAGLLSMSNEVTVLRAFIDFLHLPTSDVVLHMKNQLANSLRAQGKNAEAARTWSELVTEFETAHRPEEAARARLSCANAHAAAGEHTKAAEGFEDALGRAHGLGPALEASVLADYGLYLDDRAAPNALARLEEGVAAARRAAAPQLLAHSLGVYGVRLQHADKNEEAAKVLREAMGTGEKVTFDALVARTHLLAATRKEKCNCKKEMGSALARAVEDYLRERLPNGPIEGVRERAANDKSGGAKGFEVRYTRAATPDESEVIRGALSQVEGKLWSPAARRYQPSY